MAGLLETAARCIIYSFAIVYLWSLANVICFTNSVAVCYIRLVLYCTAESKHHVFHTSAVQSTEEAERWRRRGCSTFFFRAYGFLNHGANLLWPIKRLPLNPPRFLLLKHILRTTCAVQEGQTDGLLGQERCQSLFPGTLLEWVRGDHITHSRGCWGWMLLLRPVISLSKSRTELEEYSSMDL